MANYPEALARISTFLPSRDQGITHAIGWLAMLPPRASLSNVPVEPTPDAKPKVAPLRSKRPPSWLQCELCTRAGSFTQRLRPVFAREDHQEGNQQPDSLMLLCTDCCALVKGEIGEDEWRRRTGPAS